MSVVRLAAKRILDSNGSKLMPMLKILGEKQFTARVKRCGHYQGVRTIAYGREPGDRNGVRRTNWPHSAPRDVPRPP
jgi:hypothetical protein